MSLLPFLRRVKEATDGDKDDGDKDDREKSSCVPSKPVRDEARHVAHHRASHS